MANQRDRAKLDGAKKVVIPCAVVVALFIGWASGFDGILFGGAFWGLVIGVIYGYQWWQMHFSIRRRLKPSIELKSIADIYRSHYNPDDETIMMFMQAWRRERKRLPK